MTSEKDKTTSSAIGAALIAIVTALLVGGNTPWYFKYFGPRVPCNKLAGHYHWAGKKAEIEVKDCEKGFLRLHFPPGFPEFSNAKILAQYDKEERKIEYSSKDARFTMDGNGEHELHFDGNQYWIKCTDKNNCPPK